MGKSIKKGLEKSSKKETVSNQQNKLKSSHFRIGAKTFFFDVNIASNNNKYLKITDSRYMGEGADSIRNSVIIFPEHIADFKRSLKEMVAYLG